VAEVKLWDLTRSQECLSSPRALSAALSFDQSGRHVRSLSSVGRIQTREVDSGMTREESPVEVTQDWLTPAVVAEYSQDGRSLATLASDRTLVKVGEPETGREVATLRGLDVPASCVASDRDGGRIAA